MNTDKHIQYKYTSFKRNSLQPIFLQEYLKAFILKYIDT